MNDLILQIKDGYDKYWPIPTPKIPRWYLEPHIEKWCSDNLRGCYEVYGEESYMDNIANLGPAYVARVYIKFENDHDLILFKMRWQ